MQLTLFESADALAAGAADLITKLAAERPAAVVLLPAGNTPLPLYKELRERVGRGQVRLEHVHFFQLDELVGVGPMDKRGFHAQLTRELLGPIEQPRKRCHLLDGLATDPHAEITAHAAQLLELGGADLALLGLGSNGHVAFNEPGSELSDGARVVELEASTRSGLAAAFSNSEHLPVTGMTLGLKEIVGARQVRVLVSGAGKRQILERARTSTPTRDLPVTCFHDHPDMAFFADRSAAGSVGPHSSTPPSA